jgi:hypothetical protein
VGEGAFAKTKGMAAMPHTADRHVLILVQPEPYIAGHLLVLT